MSKERMEQARRFLELVAREGDDGTKAEYLRERGFTQEEIDELLGGEDSARTCG